MSKVSHNEFTSLRRDAKVPGKGGVVNAFLPIPLQNHFLHGTIRDSCKVEGHLPEPSACAVCGAVHREGHWQWPRSGPSGLPETICPACRQIRYNLPTGFITLSGDFIKMNREAVFNLVREHERGERALHPLRRIISIEEHPDRLLVTTTDTHLPKRIGRAMRHACKGKLTVHYEDETGFIRVNWTSDPNRRHRQNQMKRRKS